MPIPQDPLQRWWVEVSGDNPGTVEEFRQCLLAILAFGPSQEPALVGTAFVIASGEGFALALTARHVLPAGVQASQRPAPRQAASAIFVPPSWVQPSLDKRRLRALWMTAARGTEALNLVNLSYNDSLDISSFLVVPQHESHAFQPAIIPMDTTIPAVGDIVHMVSNDRLDVTETRAPSDHLGTGHELSIFRHVSIRRGVVTGVYLEGLRQYTWPCFTTSIPARPGMSGGFVYVPRDGKTVAACGVVSADISEPAAHESLTVRGESVIACIWPSLCLTVPTEMGQGVINAPHMTVYEMMKAGRLAMPIGGLDHIEIAPRSPDGFVIGYKQSAAKK